MKELVKPTKLEKQKVTTELYSECGTMDDCYGNKTYCEYVTCNMLSSDTKTGADDVIF